MGKSRASLKVIRKPNAYRPILSERERSAYHAAHRIMTEGPPGAELACPGARRSAMLEHIAKIILEATEEPGRLPL